MFFLFTMIDNVNKNLVDFASGDVIISGQFDIKKAFIVAKVQVHLEYIRVNIKITIMKC